MLITRVDENNYMFFNPDQTKPSCTIHTLDNLLQTLATESAKYSKLAFINNSEFMQRVESKLFDSVEESVDDATNTVAWK